MIRNVRDRFCGQDGMFDVLDIPKSHEQNAHFSLLAAGDVWRCGLVPKADFANISVLIRG